MSPFLEKLRLLNRKYAKAAVVVLRVLLGVVFIFSGFVKADDLRGFIYKLEEYLSVLDWTLPRTVTLTIGMTVAAVEALCGLSLLIGAYRRVVPFIMGLMMAVMLPLTAWLYFVNPISDCGCFGDAIILSNGATFLKNILITIGVIYLIKYNKYVRLRLFHPELHWLAVMGGMAYMAALSLTCYNVQPVIDFRPYPEESNLIKDIESDGSEVEFLYTKDGEEKVFTADNLPDETWTYVDRIPSETNSENEGLAVYDGDEEVSQDVIASSGKQMIYVVPEMNRIDLSYTYFVNELYRKCLESNIDFIALLATDTEGIEWWKDYSMANYACYSADDTELKSLVRGKMSIVYTEDGIIKWKRTISSLVDTYLNNKGTGTFPDNIVFDLRHYFYKITIIFAAWLIFIGIIQILIQIKTKKQKK